mmetsp:Transcript_657/g.1034  ORF Transcript_657/g.1034 Transcript_657/m.1034 type:complete len:357 (+) Transcript_657:87-1157(+)
MRSGRPLLLSISRMLDMGGMPSAATSKAARSVDTSKNLKVRCIAFDFALLTRAVQDCTVKKGSKEFSPEQREIELPTPTTPKVGMVEEIASILNVRLGGSIERRPNEAEDELLSAITGEVQSKKDLSEKEGNCFKEKDKESESTHSSILPTSDIRSKYFHKLRNRAEDGMSIDGIERAKRQIDDNLTKGDAAGHLAARAIAINQGSKNSTKWMALTGTGSLLQYVSTRNMKIALLPIPDNDKHEQEGKRMDDFTKQLPQVTFNLLLRKGKDACDILEKLCDGLSIDDPNSTLVVSDRDDYLKSAKEVGMTTCRIRHTLNGPRGNTTAHYNVTNLADVQDVINEVNGISFVAVRGQR